jgi:hypothetical protein
MFLVICNNCNVKIIVFHNSKLTLRPTHIIDIAENAAKSIGSIGRNFLFCKSFFLVKTHILISTEVEVLKYKLSKQVCCLCNSLIYTLWLFLQQFQFNLNNNSSFSMIGRTVLCKLYSIM